MTDRRIEQITERPFRRGVIANMPRSEYNAAPGLNPSSLVKRSPLHVKHAYEEQSSPGDHMLVGTVVHTLCWEPHKYAETYAVYEGKRDKRVKAYQEFLSENAGKTIITVKLRDAAFRIIEALLAEPRVKQAAAEGLAETAVFSEEHGLQCKGLLDWIATHESVLYDLKVTNDVEAHAFGRVFYRFAYDQKMACYKRWFERESGKRIEAVKLICVEAKPTSYDPPFDVAIVPIPDEVLDYGWRKAERSILEVRQCIQRGEWPGVARGEEYPLFTPHWEMEDEAELQMETAG